MAKKSKAYVISISPRGQDALVRCGVDPMEDLDAAVISEAVVRHSDSSGGKPRVSRVDGGKHRSVVVRRRALAASLLREAEKSGAKVRCGWRLADVDFDKQQVTFEGREDANEKDVVSYNMLVGADGVRSRTRTLIPTTSTRKERGST